MRILLALALALLPAPALAAEPAIVHVKLVTSAGPIVLALDARALLRLFDADPRFGYQFVRRTAAAVAARLTATRLQLLDVYGVESWAPAEGGEL